MSEDKKPEKMCAVGLDLFRASRWFNDCAERHGKAFWPVVLNSMQEGQDWADHQKDCEVCG